MKKKTLFIYILISVLVIAASALAVYFVSQNNASTEEAVNDGTDPTVQAFAPKKEKDKDAEPENTLLIYMIGSDLESRSGAGTDDMKEIQSSGIDLDTNNVLVFAGGSTKWHNDITSKDKINVLQLGENGFEVVTLMDASSMGTAESLSEFLNFAYENYPTKSYSLIMWNHGNGPNIGYGKDMLFDSDSLTLSEMQTALRNSPFNSSNKLEWVGFDACLMSSAELVCVWDDYAKYLVASQEIEPAFGWNYSVLKPYGSSDSRSFLSDLTDSYLSTCLEYYKKRGYSGKDITLACIDLSYGSELEAAINQLFSKASADVNSKYNDLVRQRVATRSLGRASTGSEYDLVDLSDMAAQLGSIYPRETENLNEVIDKMIVRNGTNAQQCCGLSLYYPFYNKYHYEDSWADAYSAIGLFDSYREYLKKYQQKWLTDTDLDKYEKSAVPQKVDGQNRSNEIAGTYMLALSPEQNANFAEAKVYVMERSVSEAETYQNIITSANVKNVDGILYADISGKAIYVKDNFGNRTIPVMVVNDTVGDVTRFTCRLTAINYEFNSSFIKDSSVFDVQFALNNSTEELSMVAVYPYNPPSKANEISSGKLEDGDLNNYNEYWFPRVANKYITRNKKGAILPLDNWVSSGLFYSETFQRENGLNFVYEPMDTETAYYVMFEVTDTQGGKYCSELLEIDPDEQSAENQYTAPDDIELYWNDGNEFEFYNQNGFSLKLKRQFGAADYPEYLVIAENRNDYPVNIRFKDVVAGGLSLDYVYLSLPANSVDTSYLFYGYEIETPVESGILTDIASISGSLEITANNGSNYIVKDQKITVNCSEETGFYNISQYFDGFTPSIKPYMGALAEKQILHDDGKTRITLISMGTASTSLKFCILCENLTDQSRNISCNGIAVNNKMLKDPLQYGVLPAHSMSLYEFSVFEEVFYSQKIQQIENVSLRFSSGVHDQALFNTPDGGKWFDIELTQSGKDLSSDIEGEVVYDANNIRITILDFGIDKKGNNSDPVWYAFVENNSDHDISLYLTDEANTLTNTVTVSPQAIGSHKDAFVTFTNSHSSFQMPTEDKLPLPYSTINIHIMDYEEYKLLFKCDKPVTLYIQNPRDKTAYIEMKSDSAVISESNDFVLLLKKGENPDDNSAYYLNLENKSDKTIRVDFNKIRVNDNIVLDQALSIYSPNSGTSNTYTANIPVDTLYLLGDVESIDSISGELTLSAEYNGNKINILNKQPIKITFSGNGKMDFASLDYKKATILPLKDALAEKQTLLENDKLRITLMYFGENSITDSNAYICYENLSDNIQAVVTEAGSINSITNQSMWQNLKLDPKTKTYAELSISDTWLDYNAVNSIEEVKFFFATKEYVSEVPDEFYTRFTKEVSLKKKGSATPFVHGDNVVYNKDGVKIILNKFTYNVGDIFSKTPLMPVWHLTVVNDTDNYYSLSDLGTTKDDTLGTHTNLSGTLVAPRQRLNFTFSSDKEIHGDEFLMNIVLDDWDGNRVFNDYELTSLPIAKTDTVTPYMGALATEQILYETDEYRLKLVHFGNSSFFNDEILLCLENFSDKQQQITIDGIAVNSFHMPLYQEIRADAQSVKYAVLSLPEITITQAGITSINTFAMGIALGKISYYNFSESIHWVDVTFAECGDDHNFVPGDNVIFDKSGVKIILDGFKYLDDGRPGWNVTLINNSDKDITIGDIDAIALRYIYHDTTKNDIVWLSPDISMGPNQRLTGVLHYNKHVPYDTLNLVVTIKDAYGNHIFTDDEMITLYTNDGKKFTKTKIKE